MFAVSRPAGGVFVTVAGLRLAIALLLIWLLGARARGQDDVSAPAMLQLYEARWETIEQRIVDLFYVGYGNLWLPPPGRADTGPFSVGYDVFDRFDLGRPRNETLYGTETSLKAAVAQSHRAEVNVYTDLVLNHNGFGNRFDPEFVQLGGYPGFSLTLPGVDIDGDFHDPNDGGTLDGRLAGLVDIAQEKNHQFIRHPVDPGNADNIPAGTMFNLPDAGNARFYPDQDLGGTAVFDPELGQTVTLYDFNRTDPLQGDPVMENAAALLMRNARWMVQQIGVDGFRIDAAKHFPEWVLDFMDQAVFRASRRRNHDASIKPVFMFSEVLSGDPNFVDDYVRKDLANPVAIDPNDTTVGGNRDALDFPLFFALRDNLTGNGYGNNWHNIRGAGLDTADDGLRNGSQGVAFVHSHDALPGGFPLLDNVAYAYTLLRPGNALVYFNAEEFGDGRDFPMDGRDDALGGPAGTALATLVGIRNSHGRGNFHERWIDEAFNPNGFSNIYVYERANSAVISLNSRLDSGFDERLGVQTAFPPDSVLVELTGNAADPIVDPDPNSAIPETIRVDGSGQIDIRIPRNDTHGKGYVIYGLAPPQGTLSLTNVAGTLFKPPPTPETNGITRLGDVDVITADSFEVQLATTAVTLPAPLYENDPVRDVDADGDRALLKIDEGMDINGDQVVDNTEPGSVSHGFEQFADTANPGFFSGDGNGLYEQTIDTTRLAEGFHFVTARAFRHRDPATGGDGGPPIFADFKRAIYVDRLPPESEIVAFEPFASAPSTAENRDLIARSVDQTADNMHIFLNLPAGLSDQQVLAMALTGQGNAGSYDRDQWIYGFFGVKSGNNVATVVTFEPTGNSSVRRFPGLSVQTGLGLGLGDVNFDNLLSPADLAADPNAGAFEEVLYSRNAQFNPAADVNADGSVDNLDLWDLEGVLVTAGADQATLDQYDAVLCRRGDVDQLDGTDAADIDTLYASFGSDDWLFDLNVDGTTAQGDVEVLVEIILQTSFGDVNLDGFVTSADRNIVQANMGQSSLGWAGGDIDGSGGVNQDDLDLLLANLVPVGDMDLSGAVDLDDIDDFALGLTDPATYSALRGVPAWVHGDTDGDGDQDFDDVGGFVALIGAAGDVQTVPEPPATGLLVAGMAGALLVVWRRRRKAPSEAACFRPMANRQVAPVLEPVGRSPKRSR